MYPVFSDYQRQCMKNFSRAFCWLSIYFVYSLAATITVILLEICQMMDTSIESHFSLVECLIITFISFLRFLRRQERTIEKIINLDENKHKERNQT